MAIHIAEWKKTPLLQKAAPLDARELYHTSHAQVIHMSLPPNEAIPLHTTPVDVFFYILEGSGEVHIGEEKTLVDAEVLVESPANIPHGVKNAGKDTLRFLVVKVPSS